MVRTSSSLVMSSWTRRRRSTGSSASRIACAPSTLRSRLEAVRSASRPGSSMLLAITMTSGEMGLPRFCGLLERGLDVAHQGLDLERALLPAFRLGHRLDVGLQVREALVEGADAGAGETLHEHADAAVGQLQHPHDERDGAHRVDVVGAGVVLVLLLLRGEQDHAVLGEGLVHRLDRAVAAHVEGHDHEREDHDVAQGQHRQHVRDLAAAPRPWALRSFRGLPLDGDDGLAAAALAQPRQGHGEDAARRAWRARGPRRPAGRAGSCARSGRAAARGTGSVEPGARAAGPALAGEHELALPEDDPQRLRRQARAPRSTTTRRSRDSKTSTAGDHSVPGSRSERSRIESRWNSSLTSCCSRASAETGGRAGRRVTALLSHA